MHVTVFIWGLTAILGRLISLHALALVFYRLLIVVVLMPVVIAWRRLPMRITARDAIGFSAVGAFVAVHWMLFYGCIKHAGVPVAVLCLSTVPFFTALIEPFVFRRRSSTRELVLGFGVMLGVSLLVKVETKTDSMGLAMGLGSGLFSAIFGALNGSLARRHRGEVMTFYELAAALVVTAIFFGLTSSPFVAPTAIAPRDVLLLLVLAVMCTIVPWLSSLKVLQTLTPYALALAVSLEPLYSMALAYLLFPDAKQLTWRFYAGGAVLFALIAWNTSRRKG